MVDRPKILQITTNMPMQDEIHFGIKWVSGSIFLTKVISFLTSVALARLLVPEMFGLVAMASVAMATIGVIREIGFDSAYIQRQNKDQEEERVAADTIFFIGLVLNGLLFSAGIVLSPLIADFFKTTQLENVLRILFVSFLFDAITTVPRLRLQKELEFGKQALCEIVEALSNTLIAIPFALTGWGVWSLVFGQLGSKFVFMLMTFKLSGWRPRLEFSVKIAKEMLVYGKFIWAFLVLSAIGNNLEKAIIGRFIGAESLGYYGLAFNLSTLPATNISALINRITFPFFSKVQNDLSRLKQAFLKTLSHASIISIPIAFGFWAIAENLVLAIYGSKWLPAVPLIKILILYGLSLSIASLTGPVFKAIGKPDVMLYASVFHHIIKISLLFLFFGNGVIGICYAVVIPSLVSSLIAFILVTIYLKLSTKELIKPMAMSGLCSLAMFLAIKTFELSLAANAAIPLSALLLSSIIFGMIIYFLVTFFVRRTFLSEFKNTLIAIIRSKGRLV